jgi:biopolymer transport protein ExbB/TolQ
VSKKTKETVMSHLVNWDLIRVYERMGPIARVIIILLLAMLTRAALVALDRFFCFAAARKQTRSFVRLAAAPLRDGDLAEAQRLAERKGKSHIVRIVAAGISAFSSTPLSFSQSDKIDAAMRSARQAAVLNRAEFQLRLSGLETIASTAPFVGLLGTVTGILDAFTGIGISHATGLSMVAAGIAEALMTTALGLIVAIPAVWCFNYFTDVVGAFQIEMDTASLELANYLAVHPERRPRCG